MSNYRNAFITLSFTLYLKFQEFDQYIFRYYFFKALQFD